MQNTIDYYDNNALSFIKETVAVDFTKIQNDFLNYLPKEGVILDFGCGSGRDAKYFLEQGYGVEAADGSAQVCVLASKYTGIDVKQMLFEELAEVEKYDGIWACASILHAKRTELPNILQKMCAAAKRGGVIYISFKYGTFEGERNGRYFTDMTEREMEKMVAAVPELRIEKHWITGDVREGRGDERWLNMILRK